MVTTISQETLRLKNLRSYAILDSDPEKEFDDLVELACIMLEAPFAFISFIDDKRQWFKACRSIKAKEFPKKYSLCALTISQDCPVIVTDTNTDPRLIGNPLVKSKNISFYVSVPIKSKEGFNLGTVCILDSKPRGFVTDSQLNALLIIAGQVASLLEIRQKNSVIQKQNEEILSSENKIAELAIAEYDNIANIIAYQIHENFVQTLSATKMFIESATEQEEHSAYFLKKSRETLNGIINEMRNFSKKLVPTTLPNANYCNFITDFIDQFSFRHNILIEFDHNLLKNCNGNYGLNIFRIIQNQLLICRMAKTKKIVIRLKNKPRMSLFISFLPAVEVDKEKTLIHEKNISARSRILGGELVRSVGKNGDHILNVFFN